MRRSRNIFIAVIAAFAACRAVAAEAPKRIVSLNVCTDQLLIDLVSKDRIAAVSRLADDPTLSVNASRLADLPRVSVSAEEVLAYAPDLVIVGEYTSAATTDLLRQLGLNVLVIPLARNFDGMYAAVRTMAAALGEPARGEKLIKEFVRRLASVRSGLQSRPTALAYEANGLVGGADSLVDAVLDAAGFHNQARDLKLGPGGRYPLELLVANPPDLTVLTSAADDFKTVVADNLRHPALKALLQVRASVQFPMSAWLCATPKLADAIDAIARTKKSGFAQNGSAW